MMDDGCSHHVYHPTTIDIDERVENMPTSLMLCLDNHWTKCLRFVMLGHRRISFPH